MQVTVEGRGLKSIGFRVQGLGFGGQNRARACGKEGDLYLEPMSCTNIMHRNA